MGDTALHKAAKYAHMEVLEILLEEQASINEQNEARDVLECDEWYELSSQS